MLRQHLPEDDDLVEVGLGAVPNPDADLRYEPNSDPESRLMDN